MRRTRILATVGPASDSAAGLARLLDAGADAFRLNFSHGTDAEHRATLRRLHQVAGRRRPEIAIVADLQGPKIRIGELQGGSIDLRTGESWALDNSEEPGGDDRVGVSLPKVASAARAGDRILLGDGSVELVAQPPRDGAVPVRVLHGGPVRSHAGLFLPNANLRTEALGEKDLEDLDLALSEGVDFVALSFVRAASDLTKARRRLERAGYSETGLIAKIERAQALDAIDEIVEAADGVMVARGDLGIEVPLERLALEQKRIVARANRAHRIVIVATQMLLSMIDSPRPTRAEATDVANAVLDGADCVMLSEESAVGHYPAESVGWLDRICRATEAAAARGEITVRVPTDDARAGVDRSLASAAVGLAESLSASAIVVPTHAGQTARLVAGRRPSMPVLALSSRDQTRRHLALTWGVEAIRTPRHLSLLALREVALRLVRERAAGRSFGPIVLTAGYPVEGRPTNLLTVVTPPVEETRGRTARRRRVVGR